MIEAIVSLSHCLIGVPAEIRIFFPAQLGIVSLSHCLTGVPAEIRIFFPPNWGLSHCLIVSPGSRQRSGFFSRPTGDCLIVSLSQLGFLRSIPHRIASRASHPEHRIQSIASRASHRIASRASANIASHRIASHRIASHRIQSIGEHRIQSIHPLAQRRALAGQPSRARGLRVRAQGVRALGTTGNLERARDLAKVVAKDCKKNKGRRVPPRSSWSRHRSRPPSPRPTGAPTPGCSESQKSGADTHTLTHTHALTALRLHPLTDMTTEWLRLLAFFPPLGR